MESVLSILQKTTEYFRKQGIESPRLDAELLLAQVLGCQRMRLYLDFEKPLRSDILDRLRPLVRRRGMREPIQYILGEAHFMDFVVKADRRALIPRPETEELMERIQKDVPDGCVKKAVDLGTGTAVIAISIARMYPGAEVLALDQDEQTLDLARENIGRMQLEGRIQTIRSNWFAEVSDRCFDLIVSNPPYLSEADLIEVSPEHSRFEPRQALVSGERGLEDIEQILMEGFARLVAGGRLYLEIGSGQGAAVLRFCGEQRIEGAEILQDYNRKDRFVRVRRPGP